MQTSQNFSNGKLSANVQALQLHLGVVAKRTFAADAAAAATASSAAAVAASATATAAAGAGTASKSCLYTFVIA